MDQKDKLCIGCSASNVPLVKGLCKSCYNKNYRKLHGKTLNLNTKIWQQENQEKIKISRRTPKVRFQNLKTAVKRKNQSLSITEDEYIEIIKNDCYYCDGFFPRSETGSGLDRLDNNLGYHIDNVISCCTTCNKVKNKIFSPEETKVMIQAVINLKKSKLTGNDDNI